MGRAEVGRPDAYRLQRQVSGTRSEIDDLMEATSAQLSELSHYAAVILAPPLQHTRLERVDLIPVEGDRAIVVLATETGWGMSRILAFDEPVPRSEVREVARLLTERYAGLTFQEIRSQVADAAAPATPDRVLRTAASVARRVFQSLCDRNLYISGAINMLDHPDFGDSARCGPSSSASRRSAADRAPDPHGRGARRPGHDRRREPGGGDAGVQPHHLDLHLSRPGPRRPRGGGPPPHALSGVISIVDETARLVSSSLSRVRQSCTCPPERSSANRPPGPRRSVCYTLHAMTDDLLPQWRRLTARARGGDPATPRGARGQDPGGRGAQQDRYLRGARRVRQRAQARRARAGGVHPLRQRVPAARPAPGAGQFRPGPPGGRGASRGRRGHRRRRADPARAAARAREVRGHPVQLGGPAVRSRAATRPSRACPARGPARDDGGRRDRARATCSTAACSARAMVAVATLPPDRRRRVAAKDYYGVLGVSRDADDAALKKAYRNLAPRYHPDRNPGDKKAEERFKEISEAYAVLSDPDKRAQYDRFGTVRSGGGPGRGRPAARASRHLRGPLRRSPAAGAAAAGPLAARRGHLRYDLEITLEEAAAGLESKLQIPGSRPASGAADPASSPAARPETCGTCRGQGQVRFPGLPHRGAPVSEVRRGGAGQPQPVSWLSGPGRALKIERLLKVTHPGRRRRRHELRAQRGAGERARRRTHRRSLRGAHIHEHTIFAARRRRSLSASCRSPSPSSRLGDEVEVPVLGGTATLKVRPAASRASAEAARARMPRLRGRGQGDAVLIA